MSFLSSVFNLGTGTPVNGGNVQRAAPVPQGPGTAVVNGNTGPNNQQGVATPQNQVPPIPDPTKPPPSLLDNFTSVWQTATTEDGKPVPPQVDPLTQPLFNFDPAKITETANKMDFASSVDPELVTKALGGDVAAFSDVINQAIRQAVVGMTLQNGQLVNQALLTNNQRITSALPKHINQQRLLETVDDNPVFSHPAAQPLVNSLKQLFFAKDPTASPDVIAQRVSEYLKGFSTAVVESDPAQVAARKTTAAKEEDWTRFLKE
jgi:hypothetical protein